MSHLFSALFVVAILALGSGEARAQYVPSPSASGAVYVPPGSAVETPAPPGHRRTAMGLLISGPIVLAVPWLLNGLLSLFAGTRIASPDEPGWETFRWTGFIPLVGPWIQLAAKPTSFDDDGWGPWLVVDGLLQATGLALLIAGLVVQSEPEEEPDFVLLPSVGPEGGSLVARGRF